MNESNLTLNPIMNSKDNLIKDVNNEIPTQTIDKKPIFILKKKHFIGDIIFKIFALIFTYIFMGIDNIFAHIFGLVGFIVFILITILGILFEYVVFYENHIEVVFRYWTVREKYSEIKNFCVVIMSLQKVLHIGFKNYINRCASRSVLNSLYFKKNDFNHAIEILKNKGVKESWIG